MTFIIEKDWITESGLRAVCIIVMRGEFKRHRCGYVEVPIGNPLHGVGYSDQIDCITRDKVDNVSIGKKSPILALTATCNSDGDGIIRRSLDVAIDVHGGLTYANGGDYPIKPANGGWWFGFDCAHCDDRTIDLDGYSIDTGGETRSLEYVVDECESLAKQLCELTVAQIEKDK